MQKIYVAINIASFSGSDDRRVKVTISDTSPGFLSEKIQAGSTKITTQIINLTLDEKFVIDVDDTQIDHDVLLNYDIDQHRPLDDASTTTTSLWSSSKTQAELDTKINAATPMTDNKIVKSIGTSGVDVEATGIDVDDSDNVTGINDLIIDGDLTVKGTTTTIESTELAVTDANITVNVTGTQASADAQDAGITVEMSDATDVALGYDSTAASKFRIGETGNLREVATVSHTQTLTNKTINADNNTISDIETDNLKTGVVSTDLDIAVDNTNLAGSQAVKDYVIARVAEKDDASEITYTPSDGSDYDVVPTHVDGALDELADRTNTTEGTLATHLNVNPAKHGASQIVNTPTGNLVAIDQQSANDELQTELDGRPTVSETMQNKTFDSTNTYSGSIETPTRSDVKQDTEANLVTYAATATDGQIVFATDTKKMYQIIDNELEVIGGASGSAFELTQTAHGFAVYNSVYVDDFGVWNKAQANDSETLGTHIIVEIIDVNTAVLAQSGRYVLPAHGLDIGDYYYTSESVAGDITLVEPTTYSNPIVLVDSATSVIVLPFRPSYINNTEISQQIIDLVNNSTNASVTNFIVNPVGFRSYEAQINVEIDATLNLEETFYVTGHWSGTEWNLNIESIGSDSEVEIDMLNSGQLIYSCPNYAGFVSAKISFKYNLMIRGL